MIHVLMLQAQIVYMTLTPRLRIKRQERLQSIWHLLVIVNQRSLLNLLKELNLGGGDGVRPFQSQESGKPSI